MSDARGADAVPAPQARSNRRPAHSGGKQVRRQSPPAVAQAAPTAQHGPQDAPSGGADERQSRRIRRAVNVDRVFAALADPTRRRLLEELGRRPACTATTLAAHVPVSRQAVAKHLATLRESRLVTSRRAGKEVLFSVRPDELAATASWMTGLASSWQERLQLLKHAAES
jgi:DNA-binding transcriptional ArsR family regulator